MVAETCLIHIVEGSMVLDVYGEEIEVVVMSSEPLRDEQNSRGERILGL